MLSGIVGIYQGNRILNQVMNDRGRVVFGFLALHLHYSRRPDDPTSGLTASRMKALCVETGLCSAGRATAMLLLMRYAGYLTPADSDDRRTRLLVPTQHMLTSQRERIACQFRAMSLLMQEGTDAIANLDRDEFLAELTHHFGEAFRAGYRILDSSPALYPLAERNAGMMILFSLFLATEADHNSRSARTIHVSVSALARRFGVSRPHVLKLLRDAEALGFLKRDSDSEQILLFPSLLDAMQEFIATMFVFLGECTRRSIAEISPAPDKYPRASAINTRSAERAAGQS